MDRRAFLDSLTALAIAGSIPRLGLAEGAPRGPFGADSTAEEVTAGLDLSGAVAMVTGCNSGLGFETMRVLALRGAHVIGTGRTIEKARTACESVPGKTTPVVLELSDFPSVAACAARVAEITPVVDMLVCNAGIMALPELSQVYGLERQFVVNHLGHFLLVNRLLDRVTAAPQGRVVVVSSGAHVWAGEEGIQFDNLSGEKGYDPRKAYGQSKLANGLFSLELSRRLEHTRTTSNSLHPGVIKTNLARHLPEEIRSSDYGNKSIPQGAATQCYVATAPALAGVTGLYFADCNPARPDPMMEDLDSAARLWKVSEALVAEHLGEPARG